MKLKRILLPVVLTSVGAILLAGCSGVGSYDSGSWNNNYKCTAVSGQSGGSQSIGWSTNQRAAKANALDKCRAHSANPGGCRILNCVNDAAG